MKKIIVIALSFATLAFGASSVEKKNDESQSVKKSENNSRQTTDTTSGSNSRGKERSKTRNVTKSLSKARNFTTGVSKSKSGSWGVTINPVPIMMDELIQLGAPPWIAQLGNKEVGISYSSQNGSISRVNSMKQSHYNSVASNYGHLGKKAEKKVAKAIAILKMAGTIVGEALSDSKSKAITVFNFEEILREAVREQWGRYANQPLPNVYGCQFAGSINTYSCNRGLYVLQLSEMAASFPTLKVYGDEYWSSNKIAHQSTSLSITFAKDNKEALDILASDTNSRDVVKSVRKFRSKSRDKGFNKSITKNEDIAIEYALSGSSSNSSSINADANEKLDNTVGIGSLY